MLYVLRHLFAIVLLPGTMAVVVPLWIARRSGTQAAWPTNLLDALVVCAGAALLAVGLVLFAASVLHFATRGRGTLAPWDPPRALVVSGPYRYVRNPMISGVIFTLFGIALVLRSRPHLEWAVTFVIVNMIYISAFEELQLAQRFGDPYARYCTHVRRFIPRLHPWQPE